MDFVSEPTNPPLPSDCSQRMFSLLQGTNALQLGHPKTLPTILVRSNDSFDPHWIGEANQVLHPRHCSSMRVSGVFMTMGAPGGGHEVEEPQVSLIVGRPPILV